MAGHYPPGVDGHEVTTQPSALQMAYTAAVMRCIPTMATIRITCPQPTGLPARPLTALRVLEPGVCLIGSVWGLNHLPGITPMYSSRMLKEVGSTFGPTVAPSTMAHSVCRVTV